MHKPPGEKADKSFSFLTNRSRFLPANQRQSRSDSRDEDSAPTAPPSRGNYNNNSNSDPRYDPHVASAAPPAASGGYGRGGGGGARSMEEEEEERAAKKNVEVGSFLGGGSLDIDDEDAFLYGDGNS